MFGRKNRVNRELNGFAAIGGRRQRVRVAPISAALLRVWRCMRRLRNEKSERGIASSVDSRVERASAHARSGALNGHEGKRAAAGKGRQGEGRQGEKPATRPRRMAPMRPPPLLDLSDAAVKKMIKQAKKRGFVTFDQLNEVLPSDTTSPEQIEDIMAMLSEMGINVTESRRGRRRRGKGRGRRRRAPIPSSSRSRRRPSPRPRSPSPASAPTIRCACICARWARSSCCRARAKSPSPSASRPAARR